METRANYVLIGSFTLAVIAAAIGFVLWFQSLHTTKQRSPLRVVFEGPAAGLRNGGSVNFNGIRVGEVVSVKLDNPRRVVALAMTLGDAELEQEVLAMFAEQAVRLLAAMTALPAETGALAHKLKGSARGIGAFAVADAAASLEMAIRTGHDRPHAFAALKVAVAEVRAAIAAILKH